MNVKNPLVRLRIKNFTITYIYYLFVCIIIVELYNVKCFKHIKT